MNRKILYICVLMVCALYGGALFAAPENIAMQGSVVVPKGVVSASAVIDGSVSSNFFISADSDARTLVIDLLKTEYLDTLKIYTSGKYGSVPYDIALAPINVLGLSVDLLSWYPIPTINIVQRLVPGDSLIENTVACDAAAARYVRLRFPRGVAYDVREIEVYPSTSYGLGIQQIAVDASDTKAVISFSTDRETSAQLVYGYNYEFVYEKELRQTSLDFAFHKQHTMVITDLKPRTSYRFQLRVTDYKGAVVQSDFVLFTTKASPK